MEIKSYQMPSFPKGEPAFMPLLKEHRPFVPKWDNVCPDDCLDVRGGMRLKVVFKDDEKLLETAYADMKRFLSEAGIDGDAVTCRIVKSRKAMGTEAYRVTVDDNVAVQYTPAVFNMSFNKKMATYHTLALVSIDGKE